MARANQYRLETPPQADNVSFNLEQIGALFGLWVVMSPIRLYTRGWSTLYVHVLCTGCGFETWAAYSNLTRGHSESCNACGHQRKIPQWLWQRLAQAKQRCTNPKARNWSAYGGRGVQFKFDSVTEAGLHLIEKHGLPERSMEVDRRDNDGHYERGNLRWSTKMVNRRNTQRAKRKRLASTTS